MTIKKREPMKRIAVRLPPDIVDRAKSVANLSGATESDVYRSIIVSFFEKNVNKKETIATTERSKEPA
jgi:hypothetical protein